MPVFNDLALVYCSVGQMRIFVFGCYGASCMAKAASSQLRKYIYFAVVFLGTDLSPKDYQGFHRRRLALCTATSLTHAFTSLETALQPAAVCELN